MKAKPHKFSGGMVARSASEVANSFHPAAPNNLPHQPPPPNPAALKPQGTGGQKDSELLEMIGNVQANRMNEQRAAVPFLPGLATSRSSRGQPPEILQRLSVATNNEDNFPDESFFEMLMKCQGSRLEEQRSSLPNDQENQENNAVGLPQVVLYFCAHNV